MIRINLLPEEILAKSQAKQRKIQLAAAGLVIGLVIGAASLAHWSTADKLEAKLAQQEEELKKLAAVVAKVEELERTAAAVRTRLKVIANLLKGRPLYPVFMSDLARSVPPGILITDLRTTTSDLSLKLSFSASARVSSDIAAWIKAMEGSGKFSGSEMGSVSIIAGSVGIQSSYSFTITNTYSSKL